MEKMRLRLINAAVICICLAGCAGTRGTTSGGVQNFAEVSPEIWRGGKPTEAGMRWLASRGVRTIVDLQMDDESGDLPPGVMYVPIRVSLWRCDKVDVDAVLNAIDTSPKPVFIHCLRGRDRTGLAVAAYRLRQGMPVEQIIAEMESFGTSIFTNPIKGRIRELASRTRPQMAESP